MPELNGTQFGSTPLPEVGSEWRNTAGQVVKVGAVVQHAPSLSDGSVTHRVWVERPHRVRRLRDQAFSPEGFYANHSRHGEAD